MKKGYLLFLTFSIVFCSVHGQTDIEKKIISDLIAEEFSPVPDESVINENGQKKNLTDQEESSIIIISESNTRTLDTRVDSLEEFHRIGLAGLDLYTMNDFFKKNQSSVKITKFYLDKIKIIYVSQKEWVKIMEQGGWAQYHSIYGYIPAINVSRPGINEKMNKAFIYYDAKSDKLGGAGFFIILENVNNKWIIKEKVIAWMS
jgi:asparagine synthetase A